MFQEVMLSGYKKDTDFSFSFQIHKFVRKLLDVYVWKNIDIGRLGVV